MKTYIEYIKHVHILKLGQINTTPLPTPPPPPPQTLFHARATDKRLAKTTMYLLRIVVNEKLNVTA